MEKRGKDILMTFICCRGANREARLQIQEWSGIELTKEDPEKRGGGGFTLTQEMGKFFPLKDLYQNSSLKGNHWLSSTLLGPFSTCPA